MAVRWIGMVPSDARAEQIAIDRQKIGFKQNLFRCFVELPPHGMVRATGISGCTQAKQNYTDCFAEQTVDRLPVLQLDSAT